LHESVVGGLERGVDRKSKQHIPPHAAEPHIVATTKTKQGKENDDNSEVQASFRSQEKGDQGRIVSRGLYEGIDKQNESKERKPFTGDCPYGWRELKTSPAQFRDR
jgi:hypothetical protein